MKKVSWAKGGKEGRKRSRKRASPRGREMQRGRLRVSGVSDDGDDDGDVWGEQMEVFESAQRKSEEANLTRRRRLTIPLPPNVV